MYGMQNLTSCVVSVVLNQVPGRRANLTLALRFSIESVIVWNNELCRLQLHLVHMTSRPMLIYRHCPKIDFIFVFLSTCSKKDNQMLCTVLPRLHMMLTEENQPAAVLKRVILCTSQLYRVTIKVSCTGMAKKLEKLMTVYTWFIIFYILCF